jgi:hypothetical protein
MGATLEFTRVRANDYRTAIRQLQDQEMSSDPYSGDFNTCHDYYNKSKSFESAENFCDWVEDEGEKREAYFYKLDGDRWLVGAWCAC